MIKIKISDDNIRFQNKQVFRMKMKIDLFQFIALHSALTPSCDPSRIRWVIIVLTRLNVGPYQARSICTGMVRTQF